jgi:hypothetical protein
MRSRAAHARHVALWNRPIGEVIGTPARAPVTDRDLRRLRRRAKTLRAELRAVEADITRNAR